MHFTTTTLTTFTLTAVILTLTYPCPAHAGQKVKAVWSTGSFNTVNGAQGVSGHSKGFHLLTSEGKDIYNAAYPDGYSPCATGDGRTFRLDGGCLKDAAYEFNCKLPMGGQVDSCEVFNGHGGSLGSADAEQETEFFGLGISMSGKCAVDFELAEGVQCGEQGGLTGHKL
ncbi:hypothetical protein BJY04DRAFT_219308 [Aspergillus karnatakaensis]|uniref:uncharacterized protein n=1 Tax=Aspergillus karnatakaensis TaxID=1810916 RepID=UPI003CCDAAC7